MTNEPISHEERDAIIADHLELLNDLGGGKSRESAFHAGWMSGAGLILGLVAGAQEGNADAANMLQRFLEDSRRNAELLGG